jgi:hypothetical protein
MITHVNVKEVAPGEWEWRVSVDHKETASGNADSCLQALRFATYVVRSNSPRPAPLAKAEARPAPWWRRIWRKEGRQ